MNKNTELINSLCILKFIIMLHLKYSISNIPLSIVQDDLETFGDIDNVESFLSHDGGDGSIYGTLKQTLTEHKPESSKGDNSLRVNAAFIVVFLATLLRG